MTDEDIKKLRTVIKDEVTSVVKKEIDTALEPIKRTLENHTQILEGHTRKLDILWDQTTILTTDMEGVKEGIENLESRVDQMDRKLDKVIDTNIDYGSRIKAVEQIPVIAHELKVTTLV